ncbi:polyamine ABC transporter substrate-binding protein [Stappia sp. GBMRC 2046]|uniref:Polyamine ABC transporter substrate-binding protein n=1 Tax=Stappia sediminis TaxID=2692190 RepID=A0A7X3LXZ9_9HYPH|nr:ABC transporter substrate-binding protein [Stappia sediminis]MXN67182.1 polyamine ABC transporter substrate-binding protein [Stappia sediminis]
MAIAALLLMFFITPAANAVENDAQILRLGIDAADLGTGDPHRAASRNDRAVVDMIFNGLLRYKPGEAPQIEPDIATSIPVPKIADGKQVWRFELRRDVMCHPGPRTEGYQLTADDVVFSLMRAADPDVSSYAGDYEGMTASKVDDFTVDIAFDTPLSSILFFPKVADYAGGFIVCKKAVESLGDEDFGAHPVGTGPFVFKDRVAGERIRLAANEAYFRGRPQLDGVEVRYLPDFEKRDALLRDEELDVIFGSEKPEWFDAISGDESINVDVFGVGQVITMHFNTARPPLDDIRVRKALAYAVDRDVFRSLFAQGVVENVYSPVPAEFLPGGLSREEAARLQLDYPYDPAKARELLAEAGYEDGFKLKLVTSERGHYLSNYESLRDQLAKVGIEIELEVVEHREMHRRIREDENAIVIYVAWRPNADVFLTRFFHSDSTVVTGKSPDTNFSHYDGIDKLIEIARSARDPADQVRIWKQAQVKLLSDAAALPLHYVNLVYARRKNVDYGHPLTAAMALYPQFTETTRFKD